MIFTLVSLVEIVLEVSFLSVMHSFGSIVQYSKVKNILNSRKRSIMNEILYTDLRLEIIHPYLKKF